MEANRLHKECCEITLKMSRQDYRDMVFAWRKLRSMNPEEKAVGIRLRDVGGRVRDALDSVNAPDQPLVFQKSDRELRKDWPL